MNEISTASGFPAPAFPPSVKRDHDCEMYQYAVKLVGGVGGNEPEPLQNIVAPGIYFTAVNIHNPSNCNTAQLRWRVSIANRVGFPAGITTQQYSVTIRPGQSIEIDMPDILRVTHLKFNKGFVLIESPCELDIVAVYSVARTMETTGASGPAVAFHTERVPARHLKVCSDDLLLDISTGLADWKLIAATDPNNALLPLITPMQAVTMANAVIHPNWAPSQPGTQWIGASTFSNSVASNVPGFLPGYYTFQTCFSLCSTFESPKLDLLVRNDDDAQVVLNQNAVIPIGGNFTAGPPTSLSLSTGFLPGINCLSVIVRNGPGNGPGNPIGLNLKGTMSAIRGACSDCGGGCGC